MPNEDNIISEQEQFLAEAAENDDITEYIQDKSFAALVNRFGAAEEDESIREEDFNPLITGRSSKKSLHDDLPIASSFKKEIESPTVEKSVLQNEFGSAESEFDNDSISFDEINIDTLGDLVNDFKDSVEPKNQEFNTNTRVIYVDKEVDDGIKRNTDVEVSDVFSAD